MDRVNYLFYQLFLKIKYEKRRYFLYVLSFYVGLLLPTCCIANTRSVEQVIYYTTFKGMEDSFQVDWLSRTFNTIKLDKEISYSISAFYEESFPEWENQYVSIKGIDESYFYPLPKIEEHIYNTHHYRGKQSNIRQHLGFKANGFPALLLLHAHTSQELIASLISRKFRQYLNPIHKECTDK